MWDCLNISFLLKVLLYSMFGGVAFGLILFVVVPFILATTVALRDLTRESTPHMDQKKFRTALYSGKVSHARYGKPGPTHGTFWD